MKKILRTIKKIGKWIWKLVKIAIVITMIGVGIWFFLKGISFMKEGHRIQKLHPISTKFWKKTTKKTLDENNRGKIMFSKGFAVSTMGVIILLIFIGVATHTKSKPKNIPPPKSG